MSLEEKSQVLATVMKNNSIERIDASDRLSLVEAKRRSEEIKQFCKDILTEEIDYGQIPGTGKKSLYKAGAEKICQFLMLRPDFVPIVVTEDFNKPLFFYRYRCDLFHIGTGQLVGSGIGSCNSMESSYRWRKSKRKCPECGCEVRVSRDLSKRTGKPGFYCWQKMGGCGAQFHSDDEKILSQKVDRVENEDIYDQINTIDKIAQKRSLLAPVLIVSGLSGEFTQDMDDLAKNDPKDNQDKTSEPAKKQEPKKESKADTPTSDNKNPSPAEIGKEIGMLRFLIMDHENKNNLEDSRNALAQQAFDDEKMTFDGITKLKDIRTLRAAHKHLSDQLKEVKKMKPYIERTFWIKNDNLCNYVDVFSAKEAACESNDDDELTAFCNDWFFKIFGKRLRKTIKDNKPRKMTVRVWK